MILNNFSAFHTKFWVVAAAVMYGDWKVGEELSAESTLMNLTITHEESPNHVKNHFFISSFSFFQIENGSHTFGCRL